MAEADVYAAIADPTRRRILQLLDGRELPVNELAQEFTVTRPAISQHLGVLREAGLVTYRPAGRTRYYRASPAPLLEVVDWLAYFDAFWTNRLSKLDRFLSEEP